MKKLLLSLLCLAGLSATAQTYSVATEITAEDLGKSEYILVGLNSSKNSYQAAGAYTTNKAGGYYAVVDITVNDDACDLTNVSGVAKFTIVAGTEKDSYALKTSDGKFVNFTGTTNANMTFVDEAAKAASFTITFGTDGKATITNCNETARKLQYNAGNTPRFTNYSNQSDPYLYKLSTASQKEVKTPQFSVQEGEVEAGTQVEIDCATPSAEIYYTLDGTTPDKTSTLYTGAITITETTTVKAIAYLGGKDSNVASATYTVKTQENPDVTGDTVEFNFTGDSAYNMTLMSGTDSGYPDADHKCVEGPITLTLNGNVRWWKATKGNELRFYTGSSITVSVSASTTTYAAVAAADKYVITSVNLVGATASNWDATSFTGKSESVELKTTHTKSNTAVQKIEVKYENQTTGIDDIEAEGNVAPVYYNLQGVRVANPENGLFIEVRGNKAVKVIK